MPDCDSFDSRDIAAYIAQQCRIKNLDYNNTKIQKLLYCAYGCLLAWKNRRICDEYPRAWQYGPVFPKVFRYFHKHGDVVKFSMSVADDRSENARAIRECVEEVLEVFGGMSASHLSAWSHKPGSPWDMVVNGFRDDEGAGINSFIPDDYIRTYFKNKVLEHA